MANGLALLSFGVADAYLFDQHLTLGMVVACHALVILGPTALKIGYVMRLPAQRQLSVGRMNHNARLIWAQKI